MRNDLIFVLGLIAVVVGAVQLKPSVGGDELLFFFCWLLLFGGGIMLLTFHIAALRRRSEHGW
jgi:hypothetical protein